MSEVALEAGGFRPARRVGRLQPVSPRSIRMPPQRRTEDHRRARVAVRGREGRGEHVRLKHVVGIEEGDELAGGGGDPEVARGGCAALRGGRAAQHADPCVLAGGSSGNRGAGVGGPVIDQQ